MDITAFVGKLGIVIAIVTILLFVKRYVNGDRKKSGKDPVKSYIWIICAGAGGIIGALIANLTQGFSQFNIGQFLLDAFIYAAAAAFVYDTKKATIPEKEEE